MNTTTGFFNPEILRIDEDKYIGKSLENISFIDENSNIVKIYDLLKDDPLILIITYFTCEAGCPLISKNTVHVTENIDRKFNGLILSFDVEDGIDDLLNFKNKILGTTKENASKWKFGILDQENVIKLTNSVGYKFFISRKDQIFVHPNVLIFISPNGKISRYIYGVRPKEIDVKVALAEADEFKIFKNSILDLAYLVCYSYDDSKGGYYINPVFVFGSIGLLMIISVLSLSIFVMRRNKYESK